MSRPAPLAVEELIELPAGFLADEVEGDAFYRAFQDAGIDAPCVGISAIATR